MTNELFALLLCATILIGSMTGSMWKLPAVALGVLATLSLELGWALEMMPWPVLI